MGPVAASSDRPAWPAAAALFAAALIVYAFTLYRTVPGGDSGELILVAHTLGVAHPPGYPLFTLLGKLFSLLPLGSVAWRINLLSATCSAAAAAALLLATARWTGNVWAGVLAGGLFAFSPLDWTYATGAEVFPLNDLFCAALLWLLVRYFQRPTVALARAGALLCGLGMCNQHLFALFAMPAIVGVMWKGRRTLLEPKQLAILFALFAAGLLPYAYLPLASARLPRYGWGDQTTLDGLIGHILRRDYGTFDLAGGSAAGRSTLGQRLAAFLTAVPGELFGVGVPLSLLGAWAALRAGRARAVQLVIAAMGLIYLAVFMSRANLPLTYPLQRGIQARFWVQANLILFFWAGIGLWVVGTWGQRRAQRLTRFAVPTVALALVVLPIGLRYRAQDHHATHAVGDFARAVLETLPRHALLICSGDYLTHSIRYLQEVDHVRPDVRVVDHLILQQAWEVKRIAKYQPDVALPGVRLGPGGFDLLQFMNANLGRAPIFVANGIRIPDSSYLQGYNSWPLGLVQALISKPTELDLDAWLRRDAEALARFSPPHPGRDPEESWEHEVLRQYWYSRYVLGVELINYASRHDHDLRASRHAVGTLEAVAAAGVFDQPELDKNLGGAYWELSARDSNARAPMVRSFTRYLERVPDAGDRADVQAMMAQPFNR